MKRIQVVLVQLNLLIFVCFSSNLFSQQNATPGSFVYRQIGPDTLKAYVFKPTTPSKKHPAILLFHGGAWRLGDASWTFQRAREFAEKGIVAVCIDYRLANNGLSPIDGVEDACYAFAWARDHAETLGIDKKRVAGYGVSAGGHLVACAGTLPFVKGMKINDNSRPNIMLLYSPALNMDNDEYFNDLMKGKGDPASYSPSEYISNKLPPTLIIQGEQDSIVLTPDARAFRDAAIKMGAKCTLFVYPGVGHLLTRNLKVQYKDFDSNPIFVADAQKQENSFLQLNGYLK